MTAATAPTGTAGRTTTSAFSRIYGLGSAYAILTFITVMIVAFLYIRTVGGNIRGIAED